MNKMYVVQMKTKLVEFHNSLFDLHSFYLQHIQ